MAREIGDEKNGEPVRACKKKKIASKTEPEQNGNGKPVRTLIQ